MRIIYLLFLPILIPAAWADQVESMSELALLPAYCRGTQQIRSISKDTTPIEQYMAIYGAAYYHFHHYCWALNAENNADKISDDYLRQSKLGSSLSDYQYFLDHAPPTFTLLPEVYTSRARVLFKLKRDDEAVKDLNTAIRLKPDYSVAYARLGDYYQRIGDKDDAIKILERGISYTRNPTNAAYFIAKLEKLGKPFQGVPGSAVQNEKDVANDYGKAPEKNGTASTQASQSDSASAVIPSENMSGPPGQTIPADQAAQPKPYCRFCP